MLGLRAGIEAFVGWALPTKKTLIRICSNVAGTTIKAKYGTTPLEKVPRLVYGDRPRSGARDGRPVEERGQCVFDGLPERPSNGDSNRHTLDLPMRPFFFTPGRPCGRGQGSLLPYLFVFTFFGMTAASVFPGPACLFAGEVPATLHSINCVTAVRPALTAKLRRKGLQYGLPILIRIFKEEGELEVWMRSGETFKLFESYFVCDSSREPGPKEREGDRKSPEGFYYVTPSQLKPDSRFHLAIDIGYPNELDLARGRTGSGLMIHGDCFSKGCFAMTDRQMEEIYALADGALRKGQPCFQVQIFPFYMTERNMKRHGKSRWRSFWLNLKEGYDLFAKEENPPEVRVQRGRYVFEGPEARTQAPSAPARRPACLGRGGSPPLS